MGLELVKVAVLVTQDYPLALGKRRHGAGNTRWAMN